MADGDAKRSHVRIAAAILAAIVVAAIVFTYLAYTAAFTSTDTVTVMSPRAGLVMERDAKVKYRGIQIGEVEVHRVHRRSGEADAGDRQQRAALHPVQRRRPHRRHNGFRRQVGGVPAAGRPRSDAAARRAPRSRPSDVQLEVNTLFQTLTDVLHKIDPINLNATLTRARRRACAATAMTLARRCPG